MLHTKQTLHRAAPITELLLYIKYRRPIPTLKVLPYFKILDCLKVGPM